VGPVSRLGRRPSCRPAALDGGSALTAITLSRSSGTVRSRGIPPRDRHRGRDAPLLWYGTSRDGPRRNPDRTIGATLQRPAATRLGHPAPRVRWAELKPHRSRGGRGYDQPRRRDCYLPRFPRRLSKPTAKAPAANRAAVEGSGTGAGTAKAEGASINRYRPMSFMFWISKVRAG
jgi:hypothetical protein